MTPHKPIGGESEHRDTGLFSYLTDSGRSSLRLILRSGFRHKRFLLPDFLCRLIPDLLRELAVEFTFYRIKEDLTIDVESVRGQRFDVLYVINYFGQRQDYRFVDNDAWILEDSVFLPSVEAPPGQPHWIGFNSFRKLSRLADGSLLRSTVALDSELIRKEEAPFSRVKYEAKRIKYEYLHEGLHSQPEYLHLFGLAERLADEQRDVFSISRTSLFNLLDLYSNLEEERTRRRANYMALQQSLSCLGLPLSPIFPHLYVLSLDRRDALRGFLREKNMFLPIYWPRSYDLDNRLYDRIMTVPVDSRYTVEDMRMVAEHITAFLGLPGVAG